MNITSPEIIIVTLIGIIASAITGTLTWIFGRRKSDAEIAEISARVFNTLIENLRSSVAQQQKTIKQQDEKIRSIRVYVEKLEGLLLTNKVVKRADLEAIRDGIGL